MGGLMVKAIPLLSNEVSIPLYKKLWKRYGVCGALLTQQLHFLICTKGKDGEGGVPWVFMSYREWANELELYGITTIRASLKALQDDHLLKVGSVHQKVMDQAKWYTLNYERLAEIVGTQNSKTDTPPVKNRQGTPIKNRHPLIREINTRDIGEKAVVFATGLKAPKLRIPSREETIQLIEEPPMAKGPTSTTAILQAHKQRVGTAKSTANTTASAIDLWRELVPKHHASVGMLPAFTIAERGQFALMVKAIPGRSDAMLSCVLPGWIGFCQFVEGQSGLKKTPDVPNIKFLLKHVGEATNYTTSKLQLIAPKKKIPVKIQASVTADTVNPPVVVEDTTESVDFLLNLKLE